MESGRSDQGCYTQVRAVDNPAYRLQWVRDEIVRVAGRYSGGYLLDVGAGEGPHRQFIEASGMRYQSHDFGSYVPDTHQPGLQDPVWDYPEHDYVCDILEIPQQPMYPLCCVPRSLSTYRIRLLH